MNSSEGYYQKTQWHTGDVIVQHKMMNIEDWIASATDELLLARTGYNINRVKNSWNSLGERLDYITTSINTIVEHGIDQTVSDLINVITEAQDAAQRADTAATLLDNMTVAAQSLPAGQQAQVLDWKKESGHYSLTLGLPVPSFSVQSTTTTIDGTTPASVSVDNTELLQRKLTFSIPVPKFTVSASAITSGSITPTATGTDLNTLNPKINFGIPVSTPQIGTVTTTSTGTIDTTNMVSLSDTNTLNPKINFNIPVQKIADVDYDQATPGTAGDFELVNGTQLNPTLHLTVPVQNISQVTATSLAAGSQPTASLEYLDAAHLNLRLNLGLPLAEPINILRTYSTVADLQANIATDVPIGHYAIISNAATNEDNGKLYMRTDTSPYYRFITDLAAATPRFAMGTINVVNADQQSVATIDVTDPANPVLNLTIPAKPILNAVNTTVTEVGTQAYGGFSGTPDNLTLNLTVPAIPQFNQNVNITTNGSQATGSITGTADDLQLNLNLPIRDQNSIAYLNTHPENNPSLIPFIFNDISELSKRGGNVVLKYDGVIQNISTNSIFDGSGDYWTINPTGKTNIVFELTLHKTFDEESIVYIDFGIADNRAKNIVIEVINTDYNQDVWTQKFNVSDNPNSHIYSTISHTPVGAPDISGGFNKIRFTFSNWATSNSFKIAQIGLYNNNSIGARETLMSRGEDDPVFRNIRPNTTETYNLGSSELKWNNVYTKQINGVNVSNSPSFTDTKNTAGATNSTDKLYLIGATEQSENPETYSRASVYIDANGQLYSNNERVLTTSDGGGGGGSGEYATITVNNIPPDENGNITITASNISGIFNVNQIPDLPASKITGTFQASQIPALNANKITDGIFNVARIPNLNADKITEGSFAPARLPVFQGATSSANGVKGVVPAPSAGDHLKLLCGAGSWISTIVPTADSALPVSAGSVYSALQNKQDNLQFDPTPRANSHNPVWSEGIYDALALKQDNLGFDNAPTENSQNILTSGTIYEALDNKQDSFDFDNTPIQYSTNAITSGAVYEALQSVSSGSITLDNTVTQNSQNGVKSSGIYAALQLKQNLLTIDSQPVQGSTNPISSGAVYTALGTASARSVNNVTADNNGNITITAGDITSGIFAAAQIPNISGNKITSGTVNGAYLGVMGGATSNTVGTKGAVPAPSAGYQARLLSGAGTWVATVAPTQNSLAPASAGEVYTALANKMPLMQVDNTVTQNSSALITSGAVYSALENIGSSGIIYSVDDSPTQNSDNLVKSGGVFNALTHYVKTVNTLTPDNNGNINLNLLDTKNTAGSTNISSKIFLIGATSQAANPQTYSNSKAYVDANGYLYSNNVKVLHSSGDTMTGDLILTNTSKIYFSSITNNVQDNYFRIQYLNRRFLVQEYIAGGNSSDGYNNYQLPIPDGDKKTYDILTTKNIITIPQGGTGANNPATARANLEITPLNIGAVAKSGDTMTGPLTVTQTCNSSNYRGNGGLKIALATGSIYPRISFFNSDNQLTGEFSVATSRVSFTSYNQGNTTDYEVYRLPTPTVALGEGSQSYNILTTKAPVSIDQGGTGATTFAQAQANLLGITPYISVATSLGITDLDDLKTGGLWQCGADTANAPTNKPFFIICLTSAANPPDRYTQIAWRSTDAVTKIVYMRKWNNSNSVWGDWEVIAAPVTTVDHGGTGGTTPAQARTNLEITPGNIGALSSTGNNTVTGTFYSNISSVFDIKTGNNGSEDAQNVFQVRTRDKNNVEVGVCRQISYADGRIGWELISRNYSMENNSLYSWRYFGVYVDKNNNITYNLPGPAAFRDALGYSNLTPANEGVNLAVKDGYTSPRIRFYTSDGKRRAIIWVNESDNRLGFLQYDSDASHYRSFYFPAVPNLTSNSGGHEIITSLGGNINGTLQTTEFRIAKSDYPMLTFVSSTSDSTAAGAIWENISTRRIILRQRSTQGYLEDYYLPTNTATSANGTYDIVTTKGIDTSLRATSFIARASGTYVYALIAQDENSNRLGDILVTASSGRMFFRQFNPSNSSGYERYYLPANSATTSAVSYYFVTTKPGSYFRYAVGDSFTTTTSTMLAGLVTSATKSLFFTIVTPKMLTAITNIRVDSFIGGVRVPTGGYLKLSDDTSTGDSVELVGHEGLSFVTSKIDDNMIRIEIKSASAYKNIVNNTSVCGAMKWKISFPETL